MAGGKPIAKSDFALPGKSAYPMDTAKRARNALSRIAQFGSPEQKATVQRAVARRYKGRVKVSQHSNEGPGMRYDFAGGDAFACPNCGYSGSPDDFKTDDGDYDDDSARRDGNGIQPSALRTPARGTGFVRNGAPLTVRSTSGAGLANSGQRAVSLARQLPVQSPHDLLISRSPDGTSVVRHRRGGNEIGKLRATPDGWVPTVNGRDGQPRAQQRAALIDMFSGYNREASSSPLQPPQVQTPLMQQFGVPAIRLANDDPGNDDAASADTSTSSGLNPRGEGIYKKLVAKGVKPAVAMAMAKRAQNKAAGSFGGK
jgi:hypothetical protein